MRKISRALAGLPLAAVAVLYFSGGERGLGQTPVSLPSGIEAAGQQNVSPAARPAAVRPAPRPPSPYEIKGQAPGGAWMVLAATYTGPHAVYMAEQVVRHLQNVRGPRWKAVYVWNFADQQRHKEEEEHNRMAQANLNVPYRRRFTRIEEQCGVLVGGYASADEANKALVYVKHLAPPTVVTPDGRKAEDVLHEGAEGNDSTGHTKTESHKLAVVNPFTRAFVILNPALPRQKVDPTAKVDKAWEALNAGEDYSLLKCRKAFTLVIKYYEGPGALQDNGVPNNAGVMAKLFGTKSRVALNATAQLAHEMARALDQSGALRAGAMGKYSARVYVMHMRNGSVVTVGGFDSLEDPRLKEVQRDLSRLRLNPVRNPNPDNSSLELFAQPLPMRVPKL